MSCISFTKAGIKCSRKANANSDVCWQHANIPTETKKPEIKVDPVLDQLNTLRIWFEQIGVQTPVWDIKNKDIPALLSIYEQRIDNYPSPALIEDAIAKGLDPFIFFSKEYEYNGTIKNLPVAGLERKNLVNSVLTFATLKRMYNKLRKGDTVRLMQEGNYRNDGVLVYDKFTLLDLAFEPDEYGNLPKGIHINDYPIVKYFEKTITHNTIVPFNTGDQKITDVFTYTLDKYPNSKPLYLYKTDKNYYIWSFNNKLKELWGKVLYFDTESELFFENALDWSDTNYDKSELIQKEYQKEMSGIKSYKVLYDLEYYKEV